MATGPDFSPKTKETLAKRAAQLCSRPKCFNHTSGPHSDPEKSINMGVAAHIRGARDTPARYEARMTDEERSDINNGIWLCVNCSTEIDKNPEQFSAKLLHIWKEVHEAQVKDAKDSRRMYNTEELQRLRKEVLELQQQLKAQDDWDKKRDQYQRVVTEGGATVYKYSGQPEHYICPSCIEQKRIEILQDQRTLAGNFQCPGCKSNFPVKPMPSLRKPSSRPTYPAVNPWSGLIDPTNV